MIKNNRGWMKIVEAFVTVLLIAGFLLIVVNEINTPADNSQLIFDLEYAMLREVQLDNTLRDSILGLDLSLGSVGAPNDVITKINNRKPNFLSCGAEICEIQDNCLSDSAPSNKEVFVQSAIITSNLSVYSPRKIKLFCWNV